MQPEQLLQQTVLFGCLDWGSGHVARSIPLLRRLLAQQNQLVIWCTPAQLEVFEDYGIAARFIAQAPETFRFKGDGAFTKELLRNAVRFLRSQRTERTAVQRLVQQYNITYILSDHRYGLYSSEIPSVFMTHQVYLPQAAGWLAQYMHRRWVRRFSEVWIVDRATNRLAGDLSRPIANSAYIGHLSRFQGGEPAAMIPGTVLAVISGPEPYAQQLFHALSALATTSAGRWRFVCPKSYDVPANSHLELITDWKQADVAFRESEWIISRNGYSTLMDVTVLGKKAILYPTPGQLEQLYLAAINTNDNWTIVHSEAALESAVKKLI